MSTLCQAAPTPSPTGPALKRGERVTWMQDTQHRNCVTTERLYGEIIGISPDGTRALALIPRGFTYWHPVGHYAPDRPGSYLYHGET